MATMKLRTAPFLAAILLLCIPLAGLAYLGTFTRLHADDFCIASSMANLGLWGGMVQLYNTWAGRFMYFFTSLLASVTGSGGSAVFPALVIGLWFLVLAWAMLPLLRRAAWPNPRLLSVAASGLILLITLSTIPNIFQAIYWRDGQINYSFPMIGVTFLSGLILRVWLAPTPILLRFCTGTALVLAFCLGGFAEAFDVMQAGTWALVLLLVLLLAGQETRRRLLPVVGATLAGSLIALVIVVIAPGNQVRGALLGEKAGLVRVITFSLRNAAFILGKLFIWNPGWALLAILVPVIGGVWLAPPAISVPAKPEGQPQGLPLRGQDWVRGVVLVPVCAFLIATAVCAPVVFMMNAYPEDRTILLPQTALVIGLVITSGLIGIGLRRLGWVPNPVERPFLNRILPGGILIVLALAAGLSLWQTAQQVPDLQKYVTQWDQRHAVLLEAHLQGQTDVTAYGLQNRSGIGDLRAEPDYWINACMAEYYGFSALRGK
jgi:hypothetical protein